MNLESRLSAFISAVGADVKSLAARASNLESTANTDKYQSGLIGSRPTPASFGVGWYFATDDNGGTLYRSNGSSWTKQTAGVNWASGTQLGYSNPSSIPGLVATSWTDVPGTNLTLPAASVPVAVRGKMSMSFGTGTAAAGSQIRIQIGLLTSTGTLLDFDELPYSQVTASNVAGAKSGYVETIFPAPYAGGTYKLAGRLLAAMPAGWGSASLASGGIWPVAWIEGVAH